MDSTPPLPPAAQDALRQGNFIEAIRIVRQETGMDLKSSKEVVELHRRLHPELKGSGGAAAAVVRSESQASLITLSLIIALAVAVCFYWMGKP